MLRSDKQVVHTKKPYLYDIECAKGFVIPMVVFVHLMLSGWSRGNQWFVDVRLVLLAFAMPFFMYLSGFVMFYSQRSQIERPRYAGFFLKRVERLLVPYLAFGMLIYFGKLGSSHFIHVDNTGLGFIDALVGLFWNTGASPAGFLWFVFTLFVISVVVPPLFWFSGRRLWLLLVLSIALYAIQLPPYLFLDRVSTYAPFFIFGGMAASQFERYLALLDRWRVLLLCAFFLSFSLLLFTDNELTHMAIVGTLSLPALHALMRVSGVYKNKILMLLGTYCYAIYLFNAIFIGLTKGILMHFLPWDGVGFRIMAPILFTVGLVAPILLKKLVLNRNVYLAKMTA